MSSLVVPIACWQRPPASKLTCTAATDDGSLLVAGTHSGAILTFGWPDPSADLRRQMVPRTVAIGHQAPVTCVVVERVEVDGVATRQNVIVSGARDGEIALWDLEDGRCLQTNSDALDTAPQGIHLSSGGRYLLCHGYSETLTVLDASTLETVRSLPVSDQWIASIALFPTDTKGVDQVVAITFDGRLHHMTFAADAMSFTRESTPQPIMAGSLSRASQIQFNRFDKRLILVQKKRCSCIYYLAESPAAAEMLAAIDCPAPDRSWTGGRFISARSIMLWTATGSTYFYYLGPETDLRVVPCAVIQSQVIVLMSDGVTAVYVDRMEIGAAGYQAYKSTACIGHVASRGTNAGGATSIGSSGHGLVCPVPANPSTDQAQMLLQFEASPNGAYRVHHTYFWASLFGSNVSHIRASGDSHVGAPVTHPYIQLSSQFDYKFQDIWPSQTRSALTSAHPLRATCSCLILKRQVALGQENGSILIVPLSAPVLHESSKHPIDRARLLRGGHHGPVTALCVPLFLRVDSVRDRRLLSGSVDGSVMLWNLDTGEALGSFLPHAMPVISFTPLPTEVGGKFKAAVVSVAADHSVSVVDVEDAVCHYKFAGHPAPVEAVYVRPLDDILVVECTDGSLYVWQIKTGHLDRVVTGPLVADILAGCDIKASCRLMLFPYASANVRRTLSVYSITDNTQTLPIFLVYQVNIKRLIDDIINGEHVLTPTTPRKELRNPVAVSGLAKPPRTSSPLSAHPFNALLNGGLVASLNPKTAALTPSSHNGGGSGSGTPEMPHKLSDSSPRGSVSGRSVSSTSSSSKRMMTFGQLFRHQSAFRARHAHSHSQRMRISIDEMDDGASTPESGPGTPVSPGLADTDGLTGLGSDDSASAAAAAVGSVPMAGTASGRSVAASGDVLPAKPTVAVPSTAPSVTSMETGVIQSILSAVLSWGVDPDLDAMCMDKLGLEPPASYVSIGFRGASGYLSFPVPPPSQPQRESEPSADTLISADRLATSFADWKVSGSMTAARLLQILSLSRSVLATRGLQADIGHLITSYGVLLPGHVGAGYMHPSFSLLAKYWQDPVADVQEAARSQFESTLGLLSSDDKTAIVAYWRPYLPFVFERITKMGMRATIILGIIGCGPPSSLNVRVCKDVAESLDMIIKDEAKSTYRLIAIEIMGRGFANWEPHINGSGVLRGLVALTGLVQPSVPSIVTGGSSSGSGGVSAASAASAAAVGQAAPAAPSTPGPAGTPSTGVVASGPAAMGAGQQLSPALMLMARQALVNVASVNAGLFVTTLTFDLVHARSVSDRGGCLKLLGMFISKKPIILYPHLTRIVDAMVKTLDPNTPHVRESLQQLVTVNFSELVKTYPGVAFHAGSQRLAVGGSDGLVIVYDLRTATKAFVLEGHAKAVHAVSFSPDGKLIATFSVDENCAKIWQPQSGFLGTLVGALSGTAAGTGAGAALASVSGAGHLKPFRSFPVGPPQAAVAVVSILREVRFSWVGERAVRLSSIKEFEMMFNV